MSPNQTQNGGDGPAAMVFSGPADALEAVVPVDPGQRRSIRAEVDGMDQLRVLTAPAGTAGTLVRLMAPPDAGPGQHRGRLWVGDLELEIAFAIPERVSLHIVPPSLRFSCTVGGEDHADLLVTNTGNAPVTLRALHAVGLLEDGAVERAIGASLRSTCGPGESRTDLFAERLSESYGGAARLRLEGPNLEIPAGGSANLVTRLRPRDVQPNRRYHGVWTVEDVRIPLYVAVSARIRARRAARPPSGA